jgi:hypothetical protein
MQLKEPTNQPQMPLQLRQRQQKNQPLRSQLKSQLLKEKLLQRMPRQSDIRKFDINNYER